METEPPPATEQPRQEAQDLVTSVDTSKHSPVGCPRHDLNSVRNERRLSDNWDLLTMMLPGQLAPSPRLGEELIDVPDHLSYL